MLSQDYTIVTGILVDRRVLLEDADGMPICAFLQSDPPPDVRLLLDKGALQCTVSQRPGYEVWTIIRKMNGGLT